MYIVFEEGSLGSREKGRSIVAVCSSKEKAIRMIINRYRKDEDWLYNAGIIGSKVNARKKIRKALETENKVFTYRKDWYINETDVNRWDEDLINVLW